MMRGLILCWIFAFPQFSWDAHAQLDLETQRRMIREFQEAQEQKRQSRDEPQILELPTKEGDLQVLRQEMADARLAYQARKSAPNRQAVGETTLNYAYPLVRLRDYDRAVEALKSSIKLVGGQESLSKLLIEAYTEQAGLAVEAEDYHTADRLYHEAWAEARASRVPEFVPPTAKNSRDFYWHWAQVLYDEAKWGDAASKASEALAWKIDTGPIDAFLAEVHYLQDNYILAADHLRNAVREFGAHDPNLNALGELLMRESYLERNYRTHDSKIFLLRADPRFSVDERDLRSALEQARAEAIRVFGLDTPRQIRISVYQRADYERFCESAPWSLVCSISGKLRLRSDAARGKIADLETMMKYAYGLWLIDVETRGAAPAWFAEGVAHQLAFPEGPPNGARNDLKKDLAADRLPPFENLETPFRLVGDFREAALAMATAQSGVRFLIEKNGFGVIGEMVRLLKAGEPMEVALETLTGYDYPQFLEEWSASMDQGFLTEATVDAARLRSLGRISPLGSYWER